MCSEVKYLSLNIRVESIKQVKFVAGPQPPKTKKSHWSPQGLSVGLCRVFKFVLMVTKFTGMHWMSLCCFR